MRSKKVFYGWYMVGAVFAVYMLSQVFAGYGNSVVTPILSQERGWPETTTGFCSSIMYGCAAVSALPMNVLITKKGIRFTMILGLVIGITGIAGLAFLELPRLLYLFMFSLIGVMVGGCAFGACPCLVNAWFDRNRAPAMAVYISAGSIGGFILPICARHLTEIHVRAGWIFYFAMTAAALVIAVFVIRQDPAEADEIPDGIEWTITHPQETLSVSGALDKQQEEEAKGEKVPAKRETGEKIPSISDCCKSPVFAALLFTILSVRLIHSGFTSYIVVYALHRGLSYEEGAFVLASYSFAGLFSRLSISLLDRLRINKQAFHVFCCGILAAAGYILYGAGSFRMFLLCAVLIGLGFGWLLPFWTIIVQILFGRPNFPVMNGTTNTVAQVAASAAPLFVLTIHSFTGDYSNAYVLIAILMTISTVLAAVMPIRLVRKRITLETLQTEEAQQ